MCVVCGCNDDSTQVHGHGNGHGHEPQYEHQHEHPHEHAGDLHYGAANLRTVTLEADILGANQRLANRNRAHFAAHGVTAYNLLSSPGAGKTTLLCATISALRERAPALPLAVIEGDQQTRLDAERIRVAGAAAIQVNTGRGCHLDARMVGDAFARLDLHRHAHAGRDPAHAGTRPEALLLIENVGNLVCPALWDLGELAKVVVLSVTEGEDKPLKYPDMFAAATLMVINKIDLLPYVEFDVARCVGYARQVNPRLELLQLSATRGDGLDPWLDWLLQEQGG